MTEHVIINCNKDVHALHALIVSLVLHDGVEWQLHDACECVPTEMMATDAETSQTHRTQSLVPDSSGDGGITGCPVPQRDDVLGWSDGDDSPAYLVTHDELLSQHS